MVNYESYFETSIYKFKSENNILESKDLGICTDISSIRTPDYSFAACECFQGCPLTDSGFNFDVVLNGEKVKTQNWVWLPNAIKRFGLFDNFEAESLTAVAKGRRAVIQKITVKNKTSLEATMPVQAKYRSNPRKEDEWTFLVPAAEKGKLSNYYEENGSIYCKTPTAKVKLSASEELTMFNSAYLWEGKITIPAGGEYTLYFAFELEYSDVEFKSIDFEKAIEGSFEWLESESDRIFCNLPHFSSSDEQLTNLYYRSLVTYMLCRWENSDLCSVPYFSTGSINGACMCSYLWDYCGGLMLHPVYDARGNKENLKAYLRNDLTTSYALNPATSGPVGPWYQVNQEKIILMVYYHVLFTGEKEFLYERVGDKTVLEWMLYHAYVADDLKKEVELFDYGKGGNAHLELRREYLYNGVMPDLNARRYMNYIRVYELTKVAGKPEEKLLERAKELKEKLKALWNKDAEWYDFIDENGKRDIRYTVQMFKFLNSPVISDLERKGLISHLNEREFLSEFGLHSMSKLDPAYDQDDIDNGGGGICTHFTMQICAQLYETGYDKLATDILKRVYWWGERMPYMGDSCAANMIANREDTPLQGDISSVSVVQMIFYYVFGIRADFNGNISVSPVKNRPADCMKIENARLCGKVFSVEIFADDTFEVIYEGRSFVSEIGQKINI